MCVERKLRALKGEDWKKYKRTRLFREFCKVSSSIKYIQMRSSLLALALALVASGI